jgi:hypothetical protein
MKRIAHHEWVEKKEKTLKRVFSKFLSNANVKRNRLQKYMQAKAMHTGEWVGNSVRVI